MSVSPRIGILHPGAMGSAIARALTGNGYEVAWMSRGRSAATRRRATDCGLKEHTELADFLSHSELVISICPPGSALALAQSVAASGFSGTYLDANAIAPQTSEHIAELIVGAGGDYLDGGVIGPPPEKAGTTRLYLSGNKASLISAYFAASPLEAIPLDGPLTAASNLKMCFSAWSKGSTALLLAVGALAEACELGPELAQEWQLSMPQLEERLTKECRTSAPKAWRFVDEMKEIAATFAAHGLPSDFHQGAAAIYASLSDFRDTADAPRAKQVFEALNRR